MRTVGRRIGKCISFILILAVTVILCSDFMIKTTLAYEEIVIVIDPGHGGGEGDDTHRGALYHETIMEKDVDLITATALYDELSQYGNLKVYMTRTDDKELSLSERVDYAASVNADYLIAVHYNASEAHRFYGAEIFVSAFSEEYAAGYSLSQNIMNWWVEDGAFSRGIKTRIGKAGTDYYGLIREGTAKSIPTIILEHGFLDNDVDFDRLGDEASWKRMGQLDATAIADYFGVKKNMVSAKVNREYTVDVPANRVDPDSTEPEDVSVTIDAYDPETGMLTYTVSASEPDGRLIYFGFDTQDLAEDEENGFLNLNTWQDGSLSMQGSYKVPEGYEGGFVARAYNMFNLYKDSEIVYIPEDFTPPNVELQGTEKGLIDGGGVQDGEQGGDVSLVIDESSDVEEKKETDGDWNLFDALNNTKKSDYDADNTSLRTKSRSNYIGMVVAIVIAVLMMIAAIAMGIKSGLDRRNKRNRRKY